MFIPNAIFLIFVTFKINKKLILFAKKLWEFDGGVENLCLNVFI